jgi:hypothetical protein
MAYEHGSVERTLPQRQPTVRNRTVLPLHRVAAAQRASLGSADVCRDSVKAYPI